MSLVIDLGLFAVGLFLGILWFSNVLLPVFYGVPRATWWALRGRVRWLVVPLYFIAPTFWFLGLFGFIALLYWLLPDFFWYLYASATFNWGQLIGIVICFIRAIASKSGKDDLNHDFLSFMRRYLTATGTRLLEERGISPGDPGSAITGKPWT